MKKLVVPAALVGGVVLSATGQQAFAATGQDIVSKAMNYQGVAYAYGSPALSTATFDCSSFTQYIFKGVYGLTLPRSSAQQATQGVAVAENDLQPGDLLFFDTSGDGGIHHVGIYVGNGQMISAELTVGVHVTNVFSGGGSQVYWQPRFVTARRIVAASAAQNAQSSSSAPVTSAPAAAPASTSSAVSAPNSAVYTVKSGDTLWKIANKYGTTVAAIQSANGLKSDLILVGQKLSVGGSASQATNITNTTSQTGTSSSAATSMVSTASASYQVKSGDSLWKIAKANGTTVSTLKSLNGLKSDMIYVGQYLKLGSTSTSSKATVVQADLQRTVTSDSTSYTVKKGDSLWEISMLQNISVNQLMKVNNLSSTLIFPGMRLVIPQ